MTMFKKDGKSKSLGIVKVSVEDKAKEVFEKAEVTEKRADEAVERSRELEREALIYAEE